MTLVFPDRANGKPIDASHVNVLQQAITTLTGQLYSVKESTFGAKGDGVTNDSTAINAALTAASTTGGLVFLPPGTYLATNLAVDSNVWLCGAGVDATKIKLPNSGNAPVIISKDFATHTGTNDTNSPVNFKISDLSIDGNKANNTSGYGIRIHGANFAISRVRIGYCKTDGITSEWSNSAGPPNTTGMTHSMEARLLDVEVHHCDGNGITWNGPHDTMASQVICWENATYGVRIQAKGVGTAFHGSHIWGAAHDVAWLIEGGACLLMGCSGEGASVAQAIFLSNDNQLMGGRWFRAGGGAGIVLGQTSPSSIPVQGNMIVTKTEGFTSTGAPLSWDNSAGGNWVRIFDRTSTTAPTGTPNATDDYDIYTPTQTWRRARRVLSMDVPGGVSTRSKAGIPADADLEWVRDNTMVVDSTNNRLYIRVNGTWKFAALT